MSAVLAPRPTVILNQTGEAADLLLASATLPVELAADPVAPPWTRAGEVDVLFTGPRNGWRDAPAQAPAGWPGRLQWVHLASAGIDFFPPWLLDVPLVTCSRGVAAVPIAEYVLTALLAHEKAWDALQVDGASRWRDTFQRVDQQALLHALDEGRLSGATLDVTDPEPLPEGHRLYRHPRVRLTPHVSWAAQDAGEATARKFVANLSRFLAGEPLEDVVDRARGY